MNVLFLCKEQDLTAERRGYARALRKRVKVSCLPADFPTDGQLDRVLRRLPEQPALIVHPDAVGPALPRGIAQTSVPTACFQIDTYNFTEQRIRWSMLFDHAILCHPGFPERFRRAGHPGALLAPLAVEADLFAHRPAEPTYEVGFAGRLDHPVYATRRGLLSRLDGAFRMNEWRRRHTYEDLAEVLLRSRVGVNVPRDDYRQDANLRCFEVMASGALLITPVPAELSSLGFHPGEHFIGYRDEAEVPSLVRHYLDHESERSRIAWAARALVLREHTYDRRAEALLELAQSANGLTAPARAWPEVEQRLVYFEFYLFHERFAAARREVVAISRQDTRRGLDAMRLLISSLVRYIRARRALPDW